MIYKMGSIFRITMKFVIGNNDTLENIYHYQLIQVNKNRFMVINIQTGNRVLSDTYKGQDGYITDVEINKFIKKMKKSNKNLISFDFEYIGHSEKLDIETIIE